MRTGGMVSHNGSYFPCDQSKKIACWGQRPNPYNFGPTWHVDKPWQIHHKKSKIAEEPVYVRKFTQKNSARETIPGTSV